MELFLFYVIGLTVVSFISIFLTENPVTQIPHASSSLDLKLAGPQSLPQELIGQRIDLIGPSIQTIGQAKAMNGEASLAELTASPAKAPLQQRAVL